MASLADDNGMKGADAKPPIATHPAFPFIVALWFAALLGLGSLMVPVPLVESLTLATGLASIVPATAPPLGFTARALMALAFAGGGALAGLVIARQVARAQRVEPTRRTNPVAADRRPISAHAELGDEGLDGVSRLTAPRGRRALTGDTEQAIEATDTPAELPEYPQQEQAIKDKPSRRIGLTALSQEPEAAGEPEYPVLEESLEELELTDEALDPVETNLLTGYAPEEAPELAAADATPGFTTFSAPFEADDSRDDTMDDRQFFHAAGEAASHDPEERQEFHFPSAGTDHSSVAPSIDLAWDDEHGESAEEMSVAEDELQLEAGIEDHSVDALGFSPPSLTRQLFVGGDEAANEAEGHELPSAFAAEYDAENDADEYAEEYLAEPVADQAFDADHGADDGDARQLNDARLLNDLGQLDDLGLVQLAQRLGESIEKRREMRAAKAALAASAARNMAAVPAVVSAPVDALAQQFGLAEPDEAAEAMAAYFSRPAPVVDQVEPAEEADKPLPLNEEAWDEEAEPSFLQPAPVYPNAELEPEPAPRQIFQAAPAPEVETPQVFHSLAGLARIDIDEEDEDEDIADLAASFSLPLSRLSLAQPEPAAENSDEPGFASQMPLSNPFHQQPQQFVRIEDEPEPAFDEAQPAVVFPAEAARTTANEPVAFESAAFQAQARANSEEHERALREALLNLQRMSGAA